jgi:DNA topoisomerase-1
MNVVVVESPAKAKTINRYLGPEYTVLASYGHIRDLPSRDGSVDPEHGFSMNWEMDERGRKNIREIANAVKKADHLYLATDPDREGEAISWHVKEVLGDRNALDGVEVKRVVFNEITKSAILDAFNHPRDLDHQLIDAYLARRALDYLVGFTLSPVLWRKLPGSRSAGRVQSVALRLVCERETEIENFTAEEYWSVEARLANAAGKVFDARLTHLAGKKLAKKELAGEAAARAAADAVQAAPLAVVRVERKQTKRNPAPPFTTSTLQQEASRKLRFSVKHTMQVAQRLYEGVSIGGETVGLITYMRTDSVQVAGEAINATRRHIADRFGDAYLPEKPRYYKTKAKNAQEAHEAIRPTAAVRRPEDMAKYLDKDQAKLYRLIWNRAVASQMEAALLAKVAVDMEPADGSVSLRANGSVIAFDGFIRVYSEGRDDREEDGDDGKDEAILPDLGKGEAVERRSVTPERHFTQPPPRYTEASLVKKMEELGIGRPSTYASILSVLRDRDYVRLESRRFMPEDRGRVVTTFLSSFFGRYVEYGFTAELENKLDEISGGRLDWKAVLDEFWEAFIKAVDETKELRIRDVLDKLDEILGPHFFRKGENGKDPRACPSCEDGRLNLKIGKFGAFIGCVNYPDCRYTRPLAVVNGDEAADGGNNGPRELGHDPKTGLAVSLRQGPYGFYVQLGEEEPAEKGGKKKKKTPKPKRASILKTMDPAAVDLDQALALLALPRDIGKHPETGEPITAGIGRYGPYVTHGGAFISLKGDDDVLTIGLNRAVAVIADSPKKDPPKQLGNHPGDGKPVSLRQGRWGAYLHHGSTRAHIPKGTDPETLTLEDALPILAAKAAKGGKRAKPKKKAAKKKTAKKRAAIKKAAAKPDPA